MLRAVPDTERVAALLVQAWSAANGVAVQAPLTAAAATAPEPTLHLQPSPT
jgi:hypothetical protein